MALEAAKSRLDAILEAFVAPPGTTVAEDKLLAAGFVVVDRNDVLYSGASGHLRFEPESEKYTVDSVSWAASLTKLITAVCLLQLVDRGLIGLDEDVGSHVPQLKGLQIVTDSSDEAGNPSLKENKNPITLRHLLTHTSGLTYLQLDPRLVKWAEATGRPSGPTVPKDVEHYTTPLVFAPGESWVYGTGYDWAGQLLEKVTGQRLSAYMQEHIFGPLGMSSTSFQPRTIPDIEKRLTAVGFRSREDQTISSLDFSSEPGKDDIDSGGSGLFGSPADYAKFLQAVLQGRLLSQKTTDEMFAPQLSVQQRAALQSLCAKLPIMMLPEFDADTPIDHGLAGVINTQDVPSTRYGGSTEWGGMLNSRWWIDRKAGIAGVIFTSVLPTGDAVVKKVYNELEKAVYNKLSKQQPLPHI